MGNTIPPNGVPMGRHYGEETEERRLSGGRSNVIYHVMLNRGDPDGSSTEIQREEVNFNQNVPEEDGPSEEKTDDEEEEGDEEESDEQFETLQILSQLLGVGGAGLRQRFRPPPYYTEDLPEPPKPTPMNPNCDLYKEIKGCNAFSPLSQCTNIVERTRALHYLHDTISTSEQITTASRYLPKHCSIADCFESRAFCGTYSDDGTVFICAPQEGNIQLYNSEGSQFSPYKSIEPRDIGWSVLSTSFSPDQNWFVYSTWSTCVHICNVYGEEEHHYSLDLHPEEDSQFCVFNTIFSTDNKEILAATSDGKLYVYDREKQARTLAVDTHQDDANGLAFSDSSGHILFTTGDDGLCKVWDRRTLSSLSPSPVGVFAGHKDGITHVDSRNDGRYLITNSKDQSIKLWDLRKFSTEEGVHATLKKVSKQAWDYRWEDPPRRIQHESLKKLAGDPSIMTYTGHSIRNTLIRCKFSPSFTTGQRFIYTGCAKGRVIIYDVLTGEIVTRLKSDLCHFCVRDVSWNPYQVGVLVATAWDGTLQLWSPEERRDYVNADAHRRPLHFW